MTTSEFKAKLIAEIESFLRCYIYEEISEEALQALDKLKDFINSLPEEPVGEDLKKASREWLRPQLDQSYANYGETKMMELTHFDGYAMLDAIEFGAQWQKNHIWHDADKELPQKDSRVLCLTQNGRHYDSCWYGSRYCEGFAYITFSEFTNVMELHNVDKWCYLNDIFPKED